MNRHLLLLPLLLAVACSTTPTHGPTYEQAARPMPRPYTGPLIVQQPPPSYPGATYSPAGTGASLVGQPSQQVQGVARSPNTRALPDEFSPDRKPGLWAADEVRAARRDEPWLLNMLLPDLQGIPTSWPLSAICADQMNRALTLIPAALVRAVNDSELEHNFNQTPCLAARLYKLCIELEVREAPARGDWEPKLANAEAAKYVKAHCRYGNTANVDAVVEAVRRALLH
jgi:hypothetical protein